MSGVPLFPDSEVSLFVRTDFSDDEAWRRLVDEVKQENADGFRAYVEFVDDIDFEGHDWKRVREAVPASENRPTVLFIADTVTLTSVDRPVIVVNLHQPELEPFRCIPVALWSVDNNLNLSNMDWEEFADATVNGVFVGYSSA